MKQFKEFVIDTLAGDVTIQGYVGSRVEPSGIDRSPEQMPCITVFDADARTYTNPRNERTGVLQIDIWSKKSAIEVDDIYERILTLLNFAQYRTGYGSTLLRWTREDQSVDLFESDRRIWHKAIRFRWWAKP